MKLERKWNKKRIIKWSIIGVILIAIIIWIVVSIMGAQKQLASLMASNNVEVAAQRGNIAVTIESTGVIEPYERYDIVPLVQGTILSAPFEEGDVVHKGDLLYQFDASDINTNLEKSQNSLDKLYLSDKTTAESIADQTIYATESGRIVNLAVKEGDTLPATGAQICEIHKDANIVVTVPFGAGQVGQIATGQSVTLVSAEQMGSFGGTVTYVSPGSTSGSDGSVLYDVEITAPNPGSVSKGDMLVATVHTPSGDIESPQAGTVDIEKVAAVNAQVGGDVKQVFVRNGDIVQKGQKLVELYNESLYDNQAKNNLDKKDIRLTMDSQRKMLEDYSITSPIDGVVMSKTAKAGDNVGTSMNANVLMTVGDLSRMVFTIQVDELDISKVMLGQTVTVEADALPDQTFYGEVTNIATEGEATNGVTTYAVKVTIQSPGDLKPGMNVTSNIVVEEKQDVLYVPMAAVKTVGDKHIVYVKTDDKERLADAPKEDQPYTKENSKNAAPAGTVEREVEVGINDENNVEIVSGLSEGEVVAISFVVQDSFSQMMGAAGGPPPDGGSGGNGGPEGGGGQ